MTDLSTEYMGLHLDNPVIVASSGLTNSAAAIKKCADAGAGAVVVKSIFEEQIIQQTKKVEQQSSGSYFHPEAAEYVSNYGKEHATDLYLKTLRQARQETSIPVIASIHCVSNGSWIEFAKRVEDTGANALELNLFVLPSDANALGTDIERIYADIVNNLTTQVSMPVSLKLGSYFSGLANSVVSLSNTPLNGMVLFNRFRTIDFDIENMELTTPNSYSNPQEYLQSLRWISILSQSVGCDLCAATGIHDGEAVIKQLLAGAKAVQICSTAYQNGLEVIGQMKDALSAWMERHDYDNIEDFCGNMSRKESDTPAAYDRVQFMKMSLALD